MDADCDTGLSPQLCGAWRVVQGFIGAVNICDCGTVEQALRHLHQELGRYPSAEQLNEVHSYSPAGAHEVFAAYVLDSWDLTVHAGSIDAGAWRTWKGDVLHKAMQQLVDADAPLLPDPDHAHQIGGEEGDEPWWELGNVHTPAAGPRQGPAAEGS